MSDAIGKLKVSTEIKRCLRSIKAEVEGAYRDEVRRLRRIERLVRSAGIKHEHTPLGVHLPAQDCAGCKLKKALEDGDRRRERSRRTRR